VTRPESLSEGHDLSEFDCGDPALNHWLRDRALTNQKSSASRTFVVAREGSVIAYYSLSTSSLLQSRATGKIRRNMPEPIPAMLIGRFAIDRRHQGQGAGRGLLSDALRRCLQVAEQAGVRVVIVDAINEQAAAFYEHCGFSRSPVEPLLLMIATKDVAAAL
jgi:GNAT superfamily N-acetyltransferase